MAETKPLEHAPTDDAAATNSSPRKNPKPLEKRPGHSLLVLRLIAVFKFIKSASLLVIGIFILRMIRLDHNIHDVLQQFVNDMRLDENNHMIHGVLEKTLGISHTSLRWLSTG